MFQNNKIKKNLKEVSTENIELINWYKKEKNTYIIDFEKG